MSDQNFEKKENNEKGISRRKFLKTGAIAGGAAVVGLALGLPSVLKTDSKSRTSELAQVPLAFASINSPYTQIPLPGRNVPKYVDPMHHFLNADRVTGSMIDVGMFEIQQQILPASLYTALATPYNAGTYVWGYAVGTQPAHYPGFSIQATKGTPTQVNYANNLPATGSVVQQFVTIDETLNWANPLGTVTTNKAYVGPPPTVAHLHGGEVPSAIDGGPNAWYTPGATYTGPGYGVPPAVGSNYPYPNNQEAATLWFHDHCLGATRTNVYSGLAAFYLLRDTYDTGATTNPANLPADLYEAEIAIQDRQFDTNGQLLFPDGYPAGLNGPPPNPTVHPYWIPEMFGDVIVVNGNSWPYMNVEPRRYRFRLLDGSNARFYSLSLMDKINGVKLSIYQIGTDGGLLDTPVAIKPPNELLIAPGERADIIVDFTGMAGKTITMYNSAKAPYPGGASPNPQTVAEIMQFRVNLTLVGTDTSFNPAAVGATLRGGAGQPNAIQRLVNPLTGTLATGVTIAKKRQLVLKEIAGPGGPLEVLVNNTKFGQPETETPTNGTTEEWEIVNTTADAHPMHLHLVQFQLMNRQAYQANKYFKAYSAAFPGGLGDDGVLYPPGVFIPGFGPPLPYNTANADGALGGNPAVSPYLQDGIIPPDPNEAGWKDTVKMYPGQVTRIIVRFTSQDGNAFSFDPSAGPGYVWHCHIVDHEDNEMMRPYRPL